MSAVDSELDFVQPLLDKGEVAELALRLERLAATEVPRALTILGSLLLDGVGLPADVPRAVRLLQRAIDLGDALAAHQLAAVYLCGFPGVPIDRREAQRLYDVAVSLGMNPQAIPPQYRGSNTGR